MKRIGVVIPVVNYDLYFVLITQILNNKLKPNIVVVINNGDSSDLYAPKQDFFQIKTVRGEPRLSVNESWEVGARLCGDVDYVSVLNDDIEINRHFFEKVLECFGSFERAGAVCPATFMGRNKHEMDKPVEKDQRFMRMPYVEGWAFTIRKEILNASYPMPEGMNTFAGDNWLWWWTYRRFKRLWYKDNDNRIYHHVGSSVTRTIHLNLKKEKITCGQKLKERLGEEYKKRG